jgi:hypothetical protein
MDDQETVLCFVRYLNPVTGKICWRIGGMGAGDFSEVKKTVLRYPLRLSQEGLIMTLITEIQLIKPKFEPAY